MSPFQIITNCLHRSRNKGVFAFQGIEREFENYNDDLIFHPLKEWKNTKIFTIIKFNIYIYIFFKRSERVVEFQVTSRSRFNSRN